jgi:DNA sulfur modification protein DndE
MALPRTSKEARDILETFRTKSGIRPNLWARAALGYSLSLAAEPEQRQYDSEGTEFQEKVFFGNDEGPIMALLRQRLGRLPKPEEVGALIKAHVERGLRHFYEEFQRLNRRGDELLLYLVKQTAAMSQLISSPSVNLLPPSPKTDSFKVILSLGRELKTGKTAEPILNGPGGAPHVAIMGRNGTGKTRTGLSLLTKIRTTASYPIPFLVFDYAKGDIASNKDFVQATAANVIALPGDSIPLAPLSIPVRDGHAVQLSARRFRDTICSVVRLGAIQKERCLHLIVRLYQDFGDRTPNLGDLVNLAETEYINNGWDADSLIACLREFSTFPLFRSASEGDEHDLFRSTHILDTHRLPEDLRKLATFLLLDRLYAEIMSLPDAPLDTQNNRQLRLIIVIDEAHHYLPCKQQTLENMVREVRSKGVAVWLFSQSPDDFDQPQYNFAREMGLSIVFSCVLEKPKMLEAVLGAKVDPRRLSQLPTGVALTRPPATDSPIEVQAWQP